MPGMYGADPVQLRALARHLHDSSTRLSSTKAALSREVQNSTLWRGLDAERFRSEWTGNHSALLAKVAQALAEAGVAIAAHAEEQERASGAGGPNTTAGGGPAGSSTPATGKNDFYDGADHSVPRYPERGQPDLTDGELGGLRELIRHAGEDNDFFEGNDTDISALSDALADLTPAQVDQLLRSLPDGELRTLAEGAAAGGKGVFNWEGTTPFERHRLLDQLLSKASREQVDRLKGLIPWAQPNGEAMGDAARPEGADASTTNQWMEPNSPVIGLRPGTDDIKQGQYGDCVVLAAAGAMANADDNWARDHVTDNGNGTVSVRLFDKNGEQQWITVTSDLPRNSHGGQLGAQPMLGGNWPAYVEKALAQVYTEDGSDDGTPEGAPPDVAHQPGNYRAIEGNWGPDAFQYLAGPDVERTRDVGVLWHAADDGRPALVTTLGETPDGAPAGYHANHAYFVTGTDEGGNIILQNPWGAHEPWMSVSPEEFTRLFSDATVVR